MAKENKEKKEKVAQRKCHHCGKPLEEGKEFCLHCGHTYTEEDPFAEEKKAKRTKKLIKLSVILGTVIAIVAIVAVAAILIIKDVNKSDFERVVEYIMSEGEADAQGVYSVKVNSNLSLTCTEDDKDCFKMVYTDTVDGFDTKITVTVDESANDNEYLWDVYLSYVSPEVGSTFDFAYEYSGYFDPALVDYTDKTPGVVVIDKVEELPEGEESSESESEQITESSTEESSEQTESSTESGDGEGEGEEEEIIVPPDVAIKEAAVDMVSWYLGQMVYDFATFSDKNNIRAELDSLGFTKLYNYLESLNPLKG